MKFKWHRRFFSAFFILAITSLFAAFYACNDFGLDPNYFPGTVKGQLRLTQVPPKKTDEFQVLLMKEFPPRSAADLAEASTGRVLNFSREDSTQMVPFEIEVNTLKEFGALIAVWKRITDSEQAGEIDPILNVVGSYCNDRDQFIKIELTESQPVVEDLVIDVNLQKVDRTARIFGKIDFIGTWPDPDSIRFLGLAFASIPEGEIVPDISLCNLPEIRLLSTEQTNSLSYDFPISTGRKLILLAWAKSFSSIEDFTFIGCDGAILTEGMTAEVNFVADFGNPCYVP